MKVNVQEREQEQEHVLSAVAARSAQREDGGGPMRYTLLGIHLEDVARDSVVIPRRRRPQGSDRRCAMAHRVRIAFVCAGFACSPCPRLSASSGASG